MKKYILFIVIPVLFLFNSNIYADTIKPTYVTTFNDRTFSIYSSDVDVSLGMKNRSCTLMYESSILTNSDYEFTFLNPDNTYYANIFTAVSSTIDYRVDPYSSLVHVIKQSFYYNNTVSSFNSATKYIYITSQVGCISPDNISFSGVEPTPEPEPPYEFPFTNSIYVPEDTTYDKCYVVQNEDVIRAYDVVPALSTLYNYRDYYINSDYIYKDGSGQWSQYSTLPICLDNEIITHDLYYRVDFYKSLIIFFILSIFCIYLPIKLFSKIFKKGVL